MKYAVFTALPYVGHVNPLLRMAAELQRRGWRVAIAMPRDLHAHIAREEPGLPLIDLGALGPVAETMRAIERAASADSNYRRGAMRFLDVFEGIWTLMFDGLNAAFAKDRPDLVVADIFTWAAFDAAEVHGVPVVANNPSLLTGVPTELLPPAPDVPFMISDQSIHTVTSWQRLLHPLVRRMVIATTALTIGRRVNAMRRSRGLAPIRIADTLRRCPILVNGAFGLDYRRPLPPNVHMVGPILPPAPPPLPADLAEWLGDGPPVIYVNLGTVVTATSDMLGRILSGIHVPGCRVLWVLKPALASLLPPALPSWLRIVAWLPSPRPVLEHPNVRAFVSHCGINSVYESIVAGTPVVGLPFYADQRDMAVRVADAGVGLWVEKSTFTAGQLRAAIQRVVSEPSFRDTLPSLQAACAAAGGIERAVELIQQAGRTVEQAA